MTIDGETGLPRRRSSGSEHPLSSLAPRPAHLDDLTVGLVAEDPVADELFDMLEASLSRRHFLSGVVRMPIDTSDEAAYQQTVESISTDCDVVVAGILGDVPASTGLLAFAGSLEERGVPCVVLVRIDSVAAARDAAAALGCSDIALVESPKYTVILLGQTAPSAPPVFDDVERALCSDPYQLAALQTVAVDRSEQEGGSGIVCAC